MHSIARDASGRLTVLTDYYWRLLEFSAQPPVGGQSDLAADVPPLQTGQRDLTPSEPAAASRNEQASNVCVPV